MFQYLKSGCRLFFSSQSMRRIALTGGTAASYSFFKQPATEFINSINAATQAKVNMAIGIGVLLLASNVFFAYKYYQSWGTCSTDEEIQSDDAAPNNMG